MKSIPCLTIVLCVSMTACVSLALNPLYRGDGDLIAVEGLEGAWTLQDADDVPSDWVFSREEGWAGYVVTIHSEGTDDAPANAAIFRVAPVELDGRRFLDFHFSGYEPQLNFWFAIQVLPVHTVARVELRDEALTLTGVNMEALQALLKAKPDATPHRVIDEQHGPNRVLLLGDTEELRRFFGTLDDATYFAEDPLTFRRAAAGEVAAP